MSVSHSLGVGPVLELLGLLVELGDGALIHHADPGIVVLVELEIERADREALLGLGDRILRDLAGLGIHLAEEHLAEIGVPDGALAIEHHVMRLDQGIRQIVFGDDHMGGLAGEPRQGLERIAPGVVLAQVDAGEPFGGGLVGVADRAQRVADQPLRLARRAARIIAAHALEDLRELVGVVGRAHDALDGVAAVAVEQERFLLVGARHAHQPFGIGELARQVAGGLELEVGGGRLPGRHVGRLGAVEVVADRPRAERIVPGLEPRRREAVLALVVADDRDRDGRAVLLGAHHHPFHDRLGGRADLAGERGRGLGRRRRREAELKQDRGGRRRRSKQCVSHSHGVSLVFGAGRIHTRRRARPARPVFPSLDPRASCFKAGPGTVARMKRLRNAGTMIPDFASAPSAPRAVTL